MKKLKNLELQKENKKIDIKDKKKLKLKNLSKKDTIKSYIIPFVGEDGFPIIVFSILPDK